jgi:hypothetical protein
MTTSQSARKVVEPSVDRKGLDGVGNLQNVVAENTFIFLLYFFYSFTFDLYLTVTTGQRIQPNNGATLLKTSSETKYE